MGSAFAVTPQAEDIGQVEIALFALDLPAAMLDDCHACLDARERDRATAFRYDRHRRRFVARRGQLRRRFAERLGEAPGAIRIHADDHGKPFLPDHPALHFNLSQSHDLALCAIGEGVSVGCDIERRDARLAGRDVAARLFAARETAALSALPAAQWVDGFFNCWTRKEAYVKALGLGLAYPLDAFAVSVAPGEPARLLDAAPGWTLTSFEPAPGYQAALVTGPPA